MFGLLLRILFCGQRVSARTCVIAPANSPAEQTNARLTRSYELRMSLIVLCREAIVLGTSSNKRRERITLDTVASQTAFFRPALIAG
jgi:hypothetical protein